MTEQHPQGEDLRRRTVMNSTADQVLTRSCSGECPFSQRWERLVIPKPTAGCAVSSLVSQLVSFRALYEERKYKCLGTRAGQREKQGWEV